MLTRPWRSADDVRKATLLSALAASTLCCSHSWANPVPVSLPPGAIPVQIIPERPEPGLPTFQMPAPGQPIPYTPPSPPTAPSSGQPGDDNATTAALMDQSWGQAAASEAQQLDVGADALAGTCVMESGCSTDAASHGTISGTFQMADATYQQMIQEAEARDPTLATSIPPGLAGKTDPAVEAIAASQYLYDGAQALQSEGVANPTFTQTRAYYQFGPTYGVQLAQADPGELVSSVVPLTAQGYANNGINPATTTVAEWQASIASKVGSTTANSTVLVGA